MGMTTSLHKEGNLAILEVKKFTFTGTVFVGSKELCNLVTSLA